MATKTKPTFRTATIKKNKSFKFGQSLSKDEKVFITEKFMGRGRWVYTAFRKKNDAVGLVVTRSEFEYTDKEKFVVLVTRISYSSRNIEVEATDRKEAEMLAIDNAGDIEFSEQNADYQSDGVWRKADHDNMFGK